MREVLMTTFQPGTFPVKVSIPVVPTVRVVITFTKFVELKQPNEDDFSIPLSSRRQFPNVDDEKSGNLSRRGHQSSGSADPFEIPSSYNWSYCSGDKSDSSRKLTKSKPAKKNDNGLNSNIRP